MTTLPVEAAGGSLELVQLLGGKGTVAVKDGAISLDLTGAPQYITLRPGK